MTTEQYQTKARQILAFYRNRAIAQFPTFALCFLPLEQQQLCLDQHTLLHHNGPSSDICEITIHEDQPFATDGRSICYDSEMICRLFMQSSDTLYQNYLQFYVDYYALQTSPDALAKKLMQELQYELSAGNGRRGKTPGRKSEDANVQQKDTFDYHQFLMRFTVSQEELLLDTDSFDYIPYHYGLTYYKNMPFLEPLEYKEVNRLDEIAIAIDTSASCSGNIVRRFLSETWSILSKKENFFSKMRLHFFQCDSMIQDYRVFTSREQWEEAIQSLKIVGHGNTDFCPVFEAIDALIAKGEIRHLRSLLYFTDGDGVFPRKPPSYETAFVFLNHELEKHKIPDWGIRLNLGDDSFEADDYYLDSFTKH